jgi:hypothetical protein
VGSSSGKGQLQPQGAARAGLRGQVAHQLWTLQHVDVLVCVHLRVTGRKQDNDIPFEFPRVFS